MCVGCSGFFSPLKNNNERKTGRQEKPKCNKTLPAQQTRLFRVLDADINKARHAGPIFTSMGSSTELGDVRTQSTRFRSDVHLHPTLPQQRHTHVPYPNNKPEPRSDHHPQTYLAGKEESTRGRCAWCLDVRHAAAVTSCDGRTGGREGSGACVCGPTWWCVALPWGAGRAPKYACMCKILAVRPCKILPHSRLATSNSKKYTQ